MPITFDKTVCTTAFMNPLKGWDHDEQMLELRRDPLLGHMSVYSKAIEAKREIMFPPRDEGYIKERAEATKASCFLCDGRWSHATPRYPEAFIEGGRIVRPGIVLFPNLFPILPYHAVIMLGEQHFRSLDDFPPPLLEEAFTVSQEFLRHIPSGDENATYVTINANYLPPAGSSVFHPHLQILGSPRPSTQHERILRASEEYFAREGRSFWDELIEAELQKGERYIMQCGRSHWITAFSPLGTNEVLGIFPGPRSFREWDNDDLRALAYGVSTTLHFYHQLGFSTFNFSLFLPPGTTPSPAHAALIRLVCRQNVAPHYRTDDYYFQKYTLSLHDVFRSFQKLMENEIIAILPEEMAAHLRAMIASRDE